MKQLNLVSTLILALGSVSACTPTVQEWVEKQEYVYSSAISAKNPLGSVVVKQGDKVFLRDDSTPVTIQPSPPYPVMDIESKVGSTFKLTTKAELTKALSAVTNASGQIDIGTASEAELRVTQPVRILAGVVKPSGQPCEGELAVVTEVLGTGSLSISAKNDIGANVGAELASKVGTLAPSIAFDSTSNTVQTGGGMFVGYRADKVKCTIISDRVMLGLQESNPIESRNKVGLFVRLGALAKDDMGWAAGLYLAEDFNPMSIQRVEATINKMDGRNNLIASLEGKSSQFQNRWARKLTMPGAGKDTKLSKEAAKDLMGLTESLSKVESSEVKDPFAGFVQPISASTEGHIGSTSYMAVQVYAGQYVPLPGGFGKPTHWVRVLEINEGGVDLELKSITFTRGERVYP